MACEHLTLPGGFHVIACGRRRHKPCHACARPAGFQCDWKLPGGKTCDRWICNDHAQEVAPDKHLCPEHQVEYRFWIFRRVLEGPRAQGGA